MLLYYKGGKIQSIVNEKSHIQDVRSATIIDFIYAVILFYFKLYSNVPMSTTWVFLGLLAGRETGMMILKISSRNTTGTLKLVGKDILFALIGLLISVTIAISVNPELKIRDIGTSFQNQSIKFIDKLF